MLTVILPFNLNEVEGEAELLTAMLYAIEMRDDSVIFDVIDNLIGDFKYEDDTMNEAETSRLSNLVHGCYDQITALITPLLSTKIFREGFVIDTIIPIGDDIKINFEYYP